MPKETNWQYIEITEDSMKQWQMQIATGILFIEGE